MARTKIAIVMGSQSDLEIVNEAINILKKFKVTYEVRILSAHRSPLDVEKFARKAKACGIEVVIAAAGGAAALPGVIASFTSLPVIGVPIEPKRLKGLDSLLAMAQMSSGVLVACMAIGRAGAKNAGLLALEILALRSKEIEKKIKSYKRDLANKVRKMNTVRIT